MGVKWELLTSAKGFLDSLPPYCHTLCRNVYKLPAATLATYQDVGVKMMSGLLKE